MTAPKYPTQIEPAIWLQEDEEQGHGDRGCTLAQYNGARLNYCTMHAAAEELLEALAGFCQLPSYKARLTEIEAAANLVRRARGGTA